MCVGKISEHIGFWNKTLEQGLMEHQAHHINIPFFAHIGVVLFGVVMMIYGVRQQSQARGSYLVRKDGKMMLFRKPLPMRRTTLAAAGFLTLLVLSLLVSAPYMRNPAPVYIQSMIGLSLPLFFLYLSGPDDIRLDGNQRAYERTIGWPWKPMTRFGSFEDIKGVCISPQNSVLLLLEKPGPISRGVVLSTSGTKTAAEALVEDLKREFGFPVAPYPKK